MKFLFYYKNYFNIHLSLNRETCELLDRQQLKLKAKSALL